MKIAVQVQIKAHYSTGVTNKNFCDLASKPFSCWILDQVYSNHPKDWNIFIDNENISAYDFFKNRYSDRFTFYQRSEWVLRDAANGNHTRGRDVHWLSN